MGHYFIYIRHHHVINIHKDTPYTKTFYFIYYTNTSHTHHHKNLNTFHQQGHAHICIKCIHIHHIQHSPHHKFYNWHHRLKQNHLNNQYINLYFWYYNFHNSMHIKHKFLSKEHIHFNIKDKMYNYTLNRNQGTFDMCYLILNNSQENTMYI